MASWPRGLGLDLEGRVFVLGLGLETSGLGSVVELVYCHFEHVTTFIL